MHTSKEISAQLKELRFNAETEYSWVKNVLFNPEDKWEVSWVEKDEILEDDIKAYTTDTLLEWLRERHLDIGFALYSWGIVVWRVNGNCDSKDFRYLVAYKTNYADCLGEAIIKILEHEAKDE